METRRWHQFLILTAMFAITTMIGTSGVAAHARLTASDPADTAVLDKAPTQVLLTFSEETSATKSGGSVTDASGATVSTGFKVDLNERTKMTITLKPNLPNGVYTVKWNSLTEDDNGTANGTFTFTVQAAATGTATATTSTAPASSSAVTGTLPTAPTPPATAAPTRTAAAPTAPATRPATTAVATGTGGATAAATTAPATLPTTGNTAGRSGVPWSVAILIAAALAIMGGLAFRLRITRGS